MVNQDGIRVIGKESSSQTNIGANQLLIKDILGAGRCKESHAEIVYQDHIRFGYTTLIARVAQLANLLTGIGVQRGDSVAVLDWDSHRQLECLLAISMIGAVYHPVNMRHQTDAIVAMMNLAEDQWLFINTDFEHLLIDCDDGLSQIKRVILFSDNDLTELSFALKENVFPSNNIDSSQPSSIDAAGSFARSQVGLHPAGLRLISQTEPVAEQPEEGSLSLIEKIVGEYESLLAKHSTEFTFPVFSEDTNAALIFTNGTTGKPKGCYFTHRQLMLHTMSVLTALSSFDSSVHFRSNDVYMPISPIFHGFGWAVPLAITMLGAKQVFTGNAGIEQILNLYVRENVTFSGGEPVSFHYFLACANKMDVSLKGWKVLVSGAHLYPDVAQIAMRAGVRVGCAWGTTETGPLICLSSLSDEVRAGSVQEQMQYRLKAGVSSPLVDVAIVDREGQFIARGEGSVGELIVRAPWISTSFVHQDGESNKGWREGWYHTGDVASIDELGCVQIYGRINDGIWPKGHWVSCTQLEELLMSMPGVDDCAMISIPAPTTGEVPVVLIVPDMEHIITLQNIKRYIKPMVEEGYLSGWSVPSRVIEVSTISRLSSGLIDRSALASLIKEDNLEATIFSG